MGLFCKLRGTGFQPVNGTAQAAGGVWEAKHMAKMAMLRDVYQQQGKEVNDEQIPHFINRDRACGL
jgi:hypothetical protein